MKRAPLRVSRRAEGPRRLDQLVVAEALVAQLDHVGAVRQRLAEQRLEPEAGRPRVADEVEPGVGKALPALLEGEHRPSLFAAELAARASASERWTAMTRDQRPSRT